MSRNEARTLPNRRKKEKKSVRAKRLKKELISLTLEETLNRWTEELPKKEAKSEPVDNAIEKAWKALVLNRNPDGGWGRFRGDKSDLWNTAFIVDCLLRTPMYKDIKEHIKIKESVEYIVDCCEDFLENLNKNGKKKSSNKTNSGKEKKENRKYEIPNSYALAHSLSVLLKTKNKGLAQKILDYLISIENPDGGWGWDQFSSSNIYGTAIVVYALIDALDPISRAGESEEKKERKQSSEKEKNASINALIGGIKWIVKDQNRDGGWGSERGSDPKRTSLALLTILHLLEEKKQENLKRTIEKNIDKYECPGIAGIDEYIDRGFEWLCLEWPCDDTSRLFSVQSKIPEKGWRIGDSRYVNRVGFESTAYAVYTLIEYEKFAEEKRKEKEKEKEEKRKENFIEGLLWLLYSQERNGLWHGYETEDGKMGGKCHNFYLALGIQILSFCKEKLAKNEDEDYFSEKIKEKDLVLLAKLSKLRDPKLMTKPKKPFFAGSHPISVIMSRSVALITAIAIISAVILLYLRREDLQNNIESFFSNPPDFVEYIFSNPFLLIFVIMIILILLISLIRLTLIIKGHWANITLFIKKYAVKITLLLRRWYLMKLQHNDDSETQDNVIEKAWEALILNRDSDGGWGRFRGDKGDLWNTAFIVDCLLRVYRYEDIKEHIKESVEYIVDCCEDFLENLNKNGKKKSSNKTNSGKEKKESRKYEIPTSYALAHSLYVLVKTKENETHESLAQKILNYLISIKNSDGGWGWDQFSSSNIYGTAIVVYALMEALESIPKELSDSEWEWDQFGLNTISAEVVGCIPPVVGEGGEPIKRLSYEEVKKAVCGGIKWIVKDQNRDGGWGSERGSDPKHTSLALLAILHLLEKHSNLKEKIEEDIDKHGCPGIAGIGKIGIDEICEWLQSQRPPDENRKYSKFIPKISEKGWRVEDSRYSDNIGFEPTAYAVYALIERKKIINDKRFTEDLKGGYNWLLYNQGLNGYWHEDEIADERIGGDRTNFYLALGILVLSLYKKKIDGKELEELLKKDLDLLAKLSNLENSTLIGFFERPLVVLSWLALFFMAVLALIVCFLGEDQIICIHGHAKDLYNFLIENPLYIGLAGLAGGVAKFHEHVTKYLSKLKGRITYGRKH